VTVVKNFDEQVVVFFGCWIALALGSFVFFRFSRSAALKKKVFRWGHLFADALFLGFMVWVGFPMQAFFLIIPALVLITTLNFWGTKFCPYCGKTMVHAYRAHFCSRCGQSLTQIREKGDKSNS